MSKNKRRPYSAEFLKKLFPYSRSEDIANSVSHIVGGGIAVIMLMYLMYVSGRYGTSNVEVFTFAFFGLSMLAMFTMSSIYHMTKNNVVRNVMKRMDHNMIFILILGTFAPFVFVGVQSISAYVLYAILVTVAIAGIIIKSIWIGKFKKIATLLYILMGWSAIMIMPSLISEVSSEAVLWMGIGGLMYTLGAILYAFGKFKYHHFIWHLFVIFGAYSHFIAIAVYLLPR